MIRKSLIAMVASAMLAAPAFAQAIDAQIELLVVAWIEDEALDEMRRKEIQRAQPLQRESLATP